MFNRKKIGFSSSTGWENSHFGGFNRIITDYPFISIPDNLTIIPDESHAGDLRQWEASKVLKMFLVCAKGMAGGVKAIFTGASSEPVVIMKKDWYTGTEIPEFYNKLTTNPGCMKSALIFVLGREIELAPLFEEYRDLIINSKFELLVERVPDKSEGEGEGEGESQEGEGSGEGEGKAGDGESKEASMDDMRDATKKLADKLKGGSESSKDDGGKGEGEGGKDGKPEFAPTTKSGHPKPDSMNVPKLTKEQIDELMNIIEEALKEAKKNEFSKKYSSGGSYGKRVGNYKKKAKFLPVKKSSVPSQLSPNESKNAEMLLKMLDITWDTDKDVVKSLRMGKIDTTKIAEVPAGNVSIYQREMEDQTTKPFSICILMDESGSMGRYYDKPSEYANRYTSMYRLVKSLYSTFSQIVPEDKMFIYGHSGCESPEIYRYHDPYNPHFVYTVDDMKERDTMENYDGPVIEAIHKRVREITDDRIILLVLSDGAPSGHGYGVPQDVADLKRIVEKARRDEFVTVGVGIQYSNIELYSYNTIVNSLDEMPKKVSHLLNKVVKSEFQ